MKIFEFTRKAIRHIAEAAEIIPKRNKTVSLPEGLNFNAKMRPQLVEDVYEAQGPNFANIKIGQRINCGRDADVFEITNHPDWVLRWEYDSPLDSRILRAVKEQDNVSGVLASNPDGTVKILKRVYGEPLYGKYWDIFNDPIPEESLIHLRQIESIPDEAFIKYYNDVLELRKNGYQVDTVNPNNILYDKKAKKFNIVDIKKADNVSPNVTMNDFHPFLDGARALSLYKRLDNVAREDFSRRVCKFFDRMIDLAKSQGGDLQVQEVDYNKLQNILVYIYHKDEEMLKILATR
ncbi:MAG: hypothetical protein E7Z93_07815 [Cyanobacteria bacterium SIG32]|nr:hypothetical protein [Cyanobacteria bacterium SIG32]